MAAQPRTLTGVPLPGTMRAAVLRGPGDVALEELPRPEPGPGEVLVQVRVTGICGSDLHVFKGTSPEPMAPRPVLGHETMGVVAQLGDGVDGLSVGQRVGVEPLVPCGRCDDCRTGRYHLCRRLKLIGMEITGGFAEFLVAPASNCFPLPPQVSDEAASLLDCVAVGVHMVQRAGIVPGDRVLVMGGGTIGLMAAQVARAVGAWEVFVADLSPYRRSLAFRLGLDEAFDAGDPQFVESVLHRTDGLGVDRVIEAVGGRAETIAQALKVVRPGGTVAFAGIFTGPRSVDLWAMLSKEVSLVPAWSYAYWGGRREFQIAIDLLARGVVNAEAVISHRFGLSKIGVALEHAMDSSRACKVVVYPSQ